MKIGLSHASSFAIDGPTTLELCKIAENGPFESLWCAEHVVLPDTVNSPYPYADDGAFDVNRDTPMPEPLIWLAYASAAAPSLTIGTCILILPQRNPLILAKELATLDVLTGGRVVLGVGLGWMREQFEALGVDWARRGKRGDEYIAAMKELWSRPHAEFHGEFVDFEPVTCSPRPVNGAIPIMMGGDTEPAMKRAVRLADGYFPGEFDANRLKDIIQKFRGMCEDAGRDPNEVEITAMFVNQLADPEAGIDQMRELGVDRIMIPAIPFRGPDGLERLQGLGEKLASLV